MAKKNVCDHLGNEFPSFNDMCDYYGIDAVTVRARLRYKWDLERALTTNSRTYKSGGINYGGKHYRNIYELCKEYGIDKPTYFHRLKNGWNLDKILNTPVQSVEKECEDHLGNKFKSHKERAEYWGVKNNTVSLRLNRNFSIKDALTKDLKHHYMIGNKEFTSVREIEKHYCVSRTTVAKILKENKNPVERLKKIEEVLRSPAYLRWKVKFAILGKDITNKDNVTVDTVELDEESLFESNN